MNNTYTWKITGFQKNNNGIISRIYWDCLASNISSNVKISVSDSISVNNDGFPFAEDLSSQEAIQWLLNRLGSSSVFAIQFNLDNKINYLLQS